MKPFLTVKSIAVPLPLDDVDTDQIIPARFLTTTSRSGFGSALFYALREGDRTFPLNDEKFRGGRILLVGRNFGCGSSREHAVWALRDGGFEVVIGKSFADIFAGNAAKNGLLLVALSDSMVDRLLAAAMEELELEVNLEAQTITLPTRERIEFGYDPFRRYCLLNGLDDLDYILSHKQEIENYFSKRLGGCHGR